jgi:glycosyltransferase involved in cell wall biosynthesis
MDSTKYNQLVSIIIPFYNAEKTLERCLKSVINQTHENIEICLINDGSTDNSEHVCKNFIIQDKRIRYLSQTNKGVSYSRNKGIAMATAHLISFIDADDWVDLNYIELLLKNLIDNEADISVGKENIIAENDVNQIVKQELEEIDILDNLKALELLFIDDKLKSYPWLKIYKKELFLNVSFPENKEAFEDYATIFKVFSKANKVVISNKIIYHYVQYNTSLSHHLTPKRAHDFFLSAIEMFEYSKNFSISEPSQKKILKKTLKQSFMCLKRIIRHEDFEKYLREIEDFRIKLKPFLKDSIFKIGIEYFVFLRIIIYCPKIYFKLKK